MINITLTLVTLMRMIAVPKNNSSVLPLKIVCLYVQANRKERTDSLLFIGGPSMDIVSSTSMCTIVLKELAGWLELVLDIMLWSLDNCNQF